MKYHTPNFVEDPRVYIPEYQFEMTVPEFMEMLGIAFEAEEDLVEPKSK